MSEPWKIRGELVLSCNCEVFCPCVVSLGKHAPTYGTCHTWWGLHIEEGRAGDEPLDGLNVAMVLGVAPVIGVPLPLFSYGGSALVTTLALTGVLLNVSMRRYVF